MLVKVLVNITRQAFYEQEVLGLLKANPASSYILSGRFDAVYRCSLHGIDDIPTMTTKHDILNAKTRTEGLEKLCELLKELDPTHWEIVDKRNPRRVLHALEVCIQTGRTYTSYRTNKSKNVHLNIIKTGIKPSTRRTIRADKRTHRRYDCFGNDRRSFAYV